MRARGKAAPILAGMFGQVTHQIFVELVVALAQLLLCDGCTFVFFDQHADIVAHGRRSNQEGWPPLWMTRARALKREGNGRA